ncbi:unnamed protein product, partial [Closterium sp. NIES-53]
GLAARRESDSGSEKKGREDAGGEGKGTRRGAVDRRRDILCVPGTRGGRRRELQPLVRAVRTGDTGRDAGSRRSARPPVGSVSGTKYGRRRAATPERAEAPAPGSSAPAAAPTPGSPAPAATPTPDSTAPAAAPAPGAAAPVAAPTPGSTAPAAAPAPGSSAPAAAPTSGSTAPVAAPAPGSSAPAVVPVAPGSVTPGAPLRRVQHLSYHARIWSREGSSRRGGEAPAPAPAPGVRLAPE